MTTVTESNIFQDPSAVLRQIVTKSSWEAMVCYSPLCNTNRSPCNTFQVPTRPFSEPKSNLSKTCASLPKNDIQAFSTFLPPHLKEPLISILNVKTPNHCVWNSRLKSSNVSIDQQHSLLLSSLEFIEALRKSGDTQFRDNILSRLFHILELWEAHIRFESSLFPSDVKQHSASFHHFTQLDENAVTLLKDALCLIKDVKTTDPCNNKHLQTLTHYLTVALQKVIFRHTALSSAGLQQVAQAARELRRNEITAARRTRDSVQGTSTRSQSDGLPQFLSDRPSRATTKMDSKGTLCSQSTHPERTRLNDGVGLLLVDSLEKFHSVSATFKDKGNEIMLATQELYDLVKSKVLHCRNVCPSIKEIYASLATAQWDDQDEENEKKQLNVTHLDYASFNESLQNGIISKEKDSKSSTMDDTVTRCRVSEKQSYSTEMLIPQLIDVSQSSSPYSSKRLSRDHFYDNFDMEFIAATKAFEIATLLIDIRKRQYRMVRGDIQLRNMTLYQPWDLAGQQFEYLINKNRKPHRHEALLIARIKHFFRECSRYRAHSFTPRDSPPCYKERLTLMRQNDTDVCVIAVFLLVIALKQKYVLCMFINKLQNNVTVSYPFDAVNSDNPFFVWLAKRFVADGHVYRRLFAEPFL